MAKTKKEETAVAVMKPIDAKEAKGLVAKMQKAVESVDIGDGPAVEELKHSIKKVKAYVTQEQNKYILPAKEIIQNAKTQYDPFLKAVAEAERMLKDRVVAFVTEAKKKEQEAKNKLAKRVEKGTMKAETAVAKMAEVGTTEATQGGIKVRMVKDYEIVDESKIPEEYWTRELNRGLIRKVALQEGKEIPGIKVIEKPQGSF